MGCEILQENEKKLTISDTFKEAFLILTNTLLSLLLPLSFLLLARLAAAQYLVNSNLYPTTQPFSALFSVILHTNPVLLYVLVCIISASTFVHSLSNSRIVIPIDQPQERIVGPHIYTAWIFICTLQVVVGLGIEGSIGAGVTGSNFGYDRSLFCRVMLFLGLHETMLYWSKTVVKPVVDDTVFGSSMEDRWAGRVLLAASFSTLWWWRLKDEVESLVVVAEVKRQVLTSVDVVDFVGWWLYYLTVTIGMVRAVKSVLWVATTLISRKPEGNAGDCCANDEKGVLWVATTLSPRKSETNVGDACVNDEKV